MRISLFLVAIYPLVAQDLAPVSIKVHVNLVNIAFVARDSTGKLVRDLSRDDLEVFEDGVKQDVKFFDRSDNLPLRLGLVVDASDSQDKFMKQHRSDLEGFITASITPRDRALLVCFNDHIRVVSDFTSSAKDLLEALDRYKTGGRAKLPELEPDNTRDEGTALFDAVYLTAVQRLKQITGQRKALILFSDGEDNSSAHDLMDAIEAAQSADLLVYTVRYTAFHHGRLTARNRYGIREMDRLAQETGAVSFDSSKEDVASSLHQVADELRAVYEVGYTTTNHSPDGLFRKVVIRCKREGLTIRAKPGYSAR
jgi:Ca-activated chloride channel family protein